MPSMAVHHIRPAPCCVSGCDWFLDFDDWKWAAMRLTPDHFYTANSQTVDTVDSCLTVGLPIYCISILIDQKFAFATGLMPTVLSSPPPANTQCHTGPLQTHRHIGPSLDNR